MSSVLAYKATSTSTPYLDRQMRDDGQNIKHVIGGEHGHLSLGTLKAACAANQRSARRACLKGVVLERKLQAARYTDSAQEHRARQISAEFLLHPLERRVPATIRARYRYSQYNYFLSRISMFDI